MASKLSREMNKKAGSYLSYPLVIAAALPVG
jgi:hypothetical protein